MIDFDGVAIDNAEAFNHWRTTPDMILDELLKVYVIDWDTIG